MQKSGLLSVARPQQQHSPDCGPVDMAGESLKYQCLHSQQALLAQEEPLMPLAGCSICAHALTWARSSCGGAVATYNMYEVFGAKQIVQCREH